MNLTEFQLLPQNHRSKQDILEVFTTLTLKILSFQKHHFSESHTGIIKNT